MNFDHFPFDNQLLLFSIEFLDKNINISTEVNSPNIILRNKITMSFDNLRDFNFKENRQLIILEPKINETTGKNDCLATSDKIISMQYSQICFGLFLTRKFDKLSFLIVFLLLITIDIISVIVNIMLVDFSSQISLYITLLFTVSILMNFIDSKVPTTPSPKKLNFCTLFTYIIVLTCVLESLLRNNLKYVFIYGAMIFCCLLFITKLVLVLYLYVKRNQASDFQDKLLIGDALIFIRDGQLVNCYDRHSVRENLLPFTKC